MSDRDAVFAGNPKSQSELKNGVSGVKLQNPSLSTAVYEFFTAGRVALVLALIGIFVLNEKINSVSVENDNLRAIVNEQRNDLREALKAHDALARKVDTLEQLMNGQKKANEIFLKGVEKVEEIERKLNEKK